MHLKGAPLKVAFFFNVVRGEKSICRETNGVYVFISEVNNSNNRTGAMPKKFVFAISRSQKSLLEGLKSTLMQHAVGAFFFEVVWGSKIDFTAHLIG